MKLHTAFTLIELLIVIAIIGILAVALLPAITTGPARARDAARIAAVNDVVSAMEQYNLDEGGYPAQTTGTEAADCLDFTAETLGTDETANVRIYFGKLPTVTAVNDELCSGDGLLFYKTGVVDASYLVAVQVERSEVANVASGITPATIRSQTLWADKAAIQADTDDPDGVPATCSATTSCFYAVVK